MTWQTTAEAGSQWAIVGFARVARILGRSVSRVFLVPIWAYFLVVRGEQRQHSRSFLTVALGRPATLRDVAKHFWFFSQVVLDRLFFLTTREKGFVVEHDGAQTLHDHLEKGQGCLLMGSHLGSFEAGRLISTHRPQFVLRILLNRQLTPTVAGVLESLDPTLGSQIIDASRDPAHIAFSLASALQDGNMVGMLCDRAGDNEKTLTVNFMGRSARLPMAPFVLAMSSAAPVMLMFGLYLGGNRYRIVFRPFAAPKPQTRSERMQQLQSIAQRYASELESLARSHPYNWFNFFDYWQDAENNT